MRSEPTIADISQRLSTQEPDVILCQEIANHGACQSHQMASALGCEHHYGPNAFRKKGQPWEHHVFTSPHGDEHEFRH